MSTNEDGEKLDQVTITDTTEITIKDDVTVITNDEQKKLSNLEQKDSSFIEEEDIKNQYDINQSTDIKNITEKIISTIDNEVQDEKARNDDEIQEEKAENDVEIQEEKAGNDVEIQEEKVKNDDEIQDSKAKNDDDQLATSTFLTETAETHLLKATDPVDAQKSSKNLVQSQPIDPAEIESALDSLLEKNKLPPEEYTNQLIQLINHKRMDCLESSDYRGAESLDSALDNLLKMNTSESHKKSIQDNEQKFSDRLDSIKSQISDVNNRYDSKMQTIQNNFEEKYQQLIDIQEVQIKKFKEKWQNPDFLKQFDRPSKNLISMRFYEKQMALSGRFKDAKGAKAQADRIQQNEEKEVQKHIEEIMKSEFLKLRSQQQQEVNKMSSRNDALLEEIEMQRKRELEPLNVALKQLDNKKKSKFSQSLKSKSANIKITIPKTNQNSPSLSQKTPRTAQRVIKYKNVCQTDLSILPIDDQQFQKLASMSNRQKARAKSSLNKKSLPPL